MKNLSAEMARFGVTNSDIQAILDCSRRTVANKLNNATEFSVSEAIKIRDALFSGHRIEYLFAHTEQNRYIRSDKPALIRRRKSKQ